jgi:hypothetical protein
LGQFLAQNKILLFPHWRNACPGQVSTMDDIRQAALDRFRAYLERRQFSGDEHETCKIPDENRTALAF